MKSEYEEGDVWRGDDGCVYIAIRLDCEIMGNIIWDKDDFCPGGMPIDELLSHGTAEYICNLKDMLP